MERTPSFHVQAFGSYYLLERIAVGGMAEIFKAKQVGVRGFEKILVIKKILQHLGEDPEFVEMFEDEAKIAAQLNHANIVQIFELGEIDGSLYITMEFVDGKNLRDITRAVSGKGVHLSVEQCVYVVSEVLKGLDFAHRKTDSTGRALAIVHRDMSPQNIVVSYEGEVKILDFGIAKAASKISRTEAGVLKGKFSYMSPEQASGKIITQQSDIYAVGVMLHELLTSERLFRAKTDMETLERVKDGTVVAPSEKNPQIPAALDEICLKALQKSVDNRYQLASEMLTDLSRFSVEHKINFSSREMSSFMRTLFADAIQDEKLRLMDALGRIPNTPVQQIQNARTHIAFKNTPSAPTTEATHKDDRTQSVKRKSRKKSNIRKWLGLSLAMLVAFALYFYTKPTPESQESAPEPLPAENTDIPEKTDPELELPPIEPSEPEPDAPKPFDPKANKLIHDIPTPPDIKPNQPEVPEVRPAKKPKPKPVEPEPKIPEPSPGFGTVDMIAPLAEGFADLYIDGESRGTVPGLTARDIRLSVGTHQLKCQTTSRVYSGKVTVKLNQKLIVRCDNLRD